MLTDIKTWLVVEATALFNTEVIGQEETASGYTRGGVDRIAGKISSPEGL